MSNTIYLYIFISYFKIQYFEVIELKNLYVYSFLFLTKLYVYSYLSIYTLSFTYFMYIRILSGSEYLVVYINLINSFLVNEHVVVTKLGTIYKQIRAFL